MIIIIESRQHRASGKKSINPIFDANNKSGRVCVCDAPVYRFYYTFSDITMVVSSVP